MTRYIVVEPHSDDAWLSLGEHILRWVENGDDVTIVTVFGDDRRMREAALYAHSVGAEHIAIGLPEAGKGLREKWTTEIPKGALDWLPKVPGVLVVPLGLRHPEHIAVSRSFLVDKWRYVELPYALTQSNADEVNEAISGRWVLSWRPRSARANASARIFKSQSMFWRNNRERMIGAVEVIVR